MKGPHLNSFRKISLRVLFVLVVASMAVAVSAQKEETETDPSTLHLPLMSDGEVFELTLEGTDGALLAAFNASEGDEISIQMISTSNVDPYLVLLGSDASILAVDDDSGEEALDSLIEDFEIPEDGTYFIIATTYSNRNYSFSEPSEGDGTTFNLVVEGNTEPAENNSTYTSVNMEIGESIDIDFTGEETAFFVTVIAEEGQELTFDAIPELGIDPFLMLFDANGLRVGVDDDGGDEPLASHLSYEVTSDGLHVALLTTFGYALVAEGDFLNSEGTIQFVIGD